MTTVSEAIVKVARNMSLVEGANMSPYSDDQIAQYLGNANLMLMEKGDWPELEVTATKTLDGTTGKATVAFTSADKFTTYRRIKGVYCQGMRGKVPMLTGYNNPLLAGPEIAWSPTNIVDDPNQQYIVRMSPVTMTGNIAIIYNATADFSDGDTVIPIDSLLHEWIATWMWAEDDGTNPGQAEKYLNLWQDRLKDIQANINAGPVSLVPFNGPTDQWWEESR